MSISTTLSRRDSVRAQIGRKTPAGLRDLAEERYDFTPEHRAWLNRVADRLSASGFLTLADVTDDEFDLITA